jgi:hypothetical protein
MLDCWYGPLLLENTLLLESSLLLENHLLLNGHPMLRRGCHLWWNVLL